MRLSFSLKGLLILMVVASLIASITGRYFAQPPRFRFNRSECSHIMHRGTGSTYTEPAAVVQAFRSAWTPRGDIDFELTFIFLGPAGKRLKTQTSHRSGSEPWLAMVGANFLEFGQEASDDLIPFASPHVQLDILNNTLSLSGTTHTLENGGTYLIHVDNDGESTFSEFERELELRDMPAGWLEELCEALKKP